MVYTTDDWTTVKTAPAYFSASVDGQIERWMAAPVISSYNPAAPGGSYAALVEFCVSYTVNGVTYWDNNHGDNYTLDAGRSLD